MWSLRGEFGITTFLSKLSSFSLPKKKKKIIGFGSLTELHLFLFQKWGWKTIYAPTLTSLAKESWGPSLETIMLKLLHSQYVNIVDEISFLNSASRKKETISANIVGGSIDFIQKTIGTTWQIHGEGNFLFLEAQNKSIDQIIGYLHFFKKSGLFKGVKALLFGAFPCTHSEENRCILLQTALESFAAEFNFPIFSNFSVGHIPNNNPVQIGGQAEIKPIENAALYKQTIKL